MKADDFRGSDPFRHGAYVTLALPDDRAALVEAAVPDLVDRLELHNEYDATAGHPVQAVGFVRRVEVSADAAAIDDDAVLRADALVHVASDDPDRVAHFCAELERLVGPSVALRTMRGNLRPTGYTGNEMHNLAYAHQALQVPATAMPNAFFLPMSKTASWWAKDWMERHTYFLPRYDDGRRLDDGHVLAAAPGVECLMRRTYKAESLPAPAGTYEFLNYFECADEDVPTFHAVCEALRDVARNPEWAFVEEGPMWHGRRVATWQELVA